VRSGWWAHLLPEGQGLSVLIENDSGQRLLFDGGPDSSTVEELGNILPPWVDTITVIAVSHLHRDHIRGLIEVAQHYNVQELWFGGGESTLPEWSTTLSELGLQPKHLPVSPTCDDAFFWGNLRITTLHSGSGAPADEEHAHDSTLSLLLQHLGRKVVLTGDLHEEDEDRMATQFAPCLKKVSVLQINHHGSRYGSSTHALDIYQPEQCWIGVGKNRYNHPHPDTLRRLREANCKIIDSRDGRFSLRLTW